jgi:hypothetical protein
MIALCILVLSVAALIEFAVSQWRSMWMTVAAQPLSDCLQTATGLSVEAIGDNDFDYLLQTTEKLCPAKERNHWVEEVKIYYRLMRALEAFSEKHAPGLAGWANKELVSCARFAAAILDERLNANLAYATDAQAR